MAHLYVVARAVKTELDRWINDLLALYIPYEHEKGKKAEIQLGVRPIQLFEIVYPEAYEEEILKAIQPYDDRGRMFATALRKLLRLKPVKKVEGYSVFKRRHPHVSVIGVGTKKDVFIKGIEQL